MDPKKECESDKHHFVQNVQVGEQITKPPSAFCVQCGKVIPLT